MILLAWIPLVDPLPGGIHWWWAWVVPMVIGVSVTWKAIRLHSLDRYWPEVFRMSGQLLVGMAALAAALMLLVRVVLPLLPAD
ncbi:MAG: hypothetical protein FJ292_09000 [Planctomycetes bacterium]|nr:hypothetical protein [Planctomycetota bacterium]